MQKRAADTVIYSFRSITNLPFEELCRVGIVYPLPFFEKEILFQLCEEALVVVKSRGALITLNAPITIVGDIHGNIHDLLRILANFQSVNSQILFLGDYVDRGSFSIEVMSLLFALAITRPSSFYLMRGNHEFASVNAKYGFKAEIMSVYSDISLYEKFNEVFTYMCFAAIVSDQIFCVHGGISPVLTSVEQIRNIQLPVVNFECGILNDDPDDSYYDTVSNDDRRDCINDNGDDNKQKVELDNETLVKNQLISDLVWSDPSPQAGTYIYSKRGHGVGFGRKMVDDFFQSTGMKKIIRAHECVRTGIKRTFGNSVFTVFSSSFYSDEENMAAYLYIDENLKFHPVTLQPAKYVTRKNAFFTSQQMVPETSGIKVAPLAMRTSFSRCHFKTPKRACIVSPSARKIMSGLRKCHSNTPEPIRFESFVSPASPISTFL